MHKNRPDGIDAMHKNRPDGTVIMIDEQQYEERSTRDLILDAAERIVEAEGASRMTIDAVVKESGFSKGGVLYHFGSKAALIEGMMDRMARAVEEDAQRAACDPDCDVLVAILTKLLDRDKERKLVRMGLLAAIAQQPELVAPIRDVVKRVHDQVADHTSDEELTHILFLAADGLRYSSMLGVDVMSEEDRARVEARLIKMAKEIAK